MPFMHCIDPIMKYVYEGESETKKRNGKVEKKVFFQSMCLIHYVFRGTLWADHQRLRLRASSPDHSETVLDDLCTDHSGKGDLRLVIVCDKALHSVATHG